MTAQSVCKYSMPSSDQLIAFLAVIREGSTLAAARRLRLDHSTVSRRIVLLEAALKARLFDRSPRGLTPTAAGLALASKAEDVEAAMLAAVSSVAGADEKVEGTVRLATPEIFGNMLVAPRIPMLVKRWPAIRLELVPETRSVSLSKREADIAVTFRPPLHGRLAARKLTDYRIGLYASHDYLAAAPAIHRRADLAQQKFVSYVEDLIYFPEVEALSHVVPEAEPIFRSSSSVGQQAAVTAGTGLGMLHILSADRDPRLLRLLKDEIEVRRSYWLILHRNLQRTPRVRAVVDFVCELVAQNRDVL